MAANAVDRDEVEAQEVLLPSAALRALVPRSQLHSNVEDNESFIDMIRKVLPAVWSQEFFPEDIKRFRATEQLVADIPRLDGVLKQSTAGSAVLKELKHFQEMQRRIMDLLNHQFLVLGIMEDMNAVQDDAAAMDELDRRLQVALVSQSASLLLTASQSTALANKLSRKAAGLAEKDRHSHYSVADATDERDLQLKFQRDLLAKAAQSSSLSNRSGGGYKKNRRNKRRFGNRGRGGDRGVSSDPDPKDAGGKKKK
tara:strand:- start:448 stop:1212 length:765 start_codon:yes stop_codon:yes gene_type:complete